MGITNIIKGIITVFLVLILMTAIPLFVVSNSIKSTLLQQEYYENIFEITGIYIKIHNTIINGIEQMAPMEQLSAYGITKTEFKNAMSKAITQAWVKNETNRIIRNILWYLNDETKGVDLSVSIRPKLNEGLVILVSEKIGVDQASALGLVSQYTATIPDSIDFEKEMPEIKPTLAELKTNVQNFKNITNIILYVIIVIIIILYILTNRELVAFTRTLGLPLIIVGIILFGGTILLSNVLVEMIKQAGTTEPESQIFMTNVVDIISPIFKDVMFQGLIILIIGILLIIFSFLYPRMTKGSNN